ncbi:MAG: N-(5'-phosphoribosyl)anthranilate isomerase [Acidobacterium sp.]|nr:phosphoribosylanthranilate isomerase [Acidobacteriota bacterium]PHY11068.1 MAG: N-(5'-phosphoribosyl)anthranilate isomerase [Acidobacterium sp.]
MTTIKICGITRRGDAEAAVAFGANALGFVLWPASPRHTTTAAVAAIVRHLPPFVTPVGVFVNPSADDLAGAADSGLRLAQVHGLVPAGVLRLPVLRAVHLSSTGDAIEPNVDDDTVLLDAHDPVRHGGTGQTVDWTRARAVAAKRRIVLAGGLTPLNVREAIAMVRPYAVDVASGVEATPGIKDHLRLRAFMDAVRGNGT